MTKFDSGQTRWRTRQAPTCNWLIGWRATNHSLRRHSNHFPHSRTRLILVLLHFTGACLLLCQVDATRPLDSRQRQHSDYQSVVQNQEDQFEPLIVISSRHSSLHRTTAPSHGQRPTTAALIGQPSQEFDSEPHRANSQSGRSNLTASNRFQLQSNELQSKQRPQLMRDSYATAPYAMTGSKLLSPSPQIFVQKLVQQQQQWKKATQWDGTRPEVSLIRDYSQLPSVSWPPRDSDQQGGSEVAPQSIENPSDQSSREGAAAAWAHQIRDNHAGLLRSRFGLEVPATSAGSSSPPSPGSDRLGGEKWPLDWQNQQQQVEATRGRISATSTTTAAAHTSSERRNSKFTKDSTGATVTTRITTGTSTNQTERMSSNDLEPATGSGQVSPLNDTDLLVLLEQNFDVSQSESLRAATAANESNGLGGPQLISNNHSLKGRFVKLAPVESLPKHAIKSGRESAARRLDLESDKISTQGILASIANQLEAGHSMVGLSNNQQARSGWSSLVSAFLQKTLGNFVRRLTGQQQQQQQQPPHSVDGGALMGSQALGQPMYRPQPQLGHLLASSISAAVQQPNSFLSPNPSTILQQGAKLQGVKSISSQQPQLIEESAASSTRRTKASPGLRQHANKKIIDSFTDLPASERRSATESYSISMQSPLGDIGASDHLRRQKRETSELDESEDSESSSDETETQLDSQKQSIPLAGNTPDGSDMEAALINSERNYESGDVLEADEQTSGQPTLIQHDNKRAAEEPDESEHDDEDEEQGDGLAELEAKSSEPSVDQPADAEQSSDQVEDDLVAEASEEAQNQLDQFYSIASGRDENEGDSGDQSAEAAASETSHSKWTHSGESSADERDEKLGGGPRQGLQSKHGPSKWLQENKLKRARSTEKPRQRIIRPPVAPPIEPVVRLGPPGATSRPLWQKAQQRRHNKPLGTTDAARRPVKPVDLSEVRRSGDKRQKRPTAVHQTHALDGIFLRPASQSSSSSSRMSPLSSSINVVDLDPAMTRVAHNKLIVAKWKQGNKLRGKLKAAPGDFVRRVAIDESTGNNPLESATISPLARISSHLSTPRLWDTLQTVAPQPTGQTQAEDRAGILSPEAQAASLASVVLGSRTITNKHISDIISRWSRPASVSAPPKSNRVFASADATTMSAATTTTNSPAISEPAETSNKVIGSESTRASEGSEQLLDGRAQMKASSPKQSSGGGDQAAPPVAHYPNHFGPHINRYDKFNFSLASMNNRERVNPILYPVDQPNRTNGLANNSSMNSVISRLKQATRTRSNGTTTTSTTTTSTTTQRPTIRLKGTSNSTTQRPTVVSTKAPAAGPNTGSSDYGSNSNDNMIAPGTGDQSSSAANQRRPIGSGDGLPFGMPKVAKPTRAQSPNDPSNDSDPLGGSQIVRNQHQNQDQARLRNQYLALIGGGRSGLQSNNSLMPSVHQETVATTSNQASSLSGHMTLAGETSELNGTDLTSPSAYESNRYSMLDDRQTSDQNDNSVVILSDNHHRFGPRSQKPTSGGESEAPIQLATNNHNRRNYHNNHGPTTQAPPLSGGLSMHYTSSQGLGVKLEQLDARQSTTWAPSSASQQLVRKFLEEFVNGTRIRPSSAIRASSTTTTTTTTAETTTSATTPAITTTEGATTEADDTIQYMTSNHQQQHAAIGAKASETTTNDLMGKLDEQAHELLLHLFERDPSYSAGLISAHNTKQQLKSTESQGDKLRQIYKQILRNSNRKQSMSTGPTERPGTDNTNNNDDDHMERLVPRVTPAATSAQTRSSEPTNRTPEFSPTSTSLPQLSDGYTAAATPVGDLADADQQSDLNNRASMRKNQAKIQAILQDIARRNETNQRLPTTTTVVSELLDLDLQELASHMQFVRPTNQPTSASSDLQTESPAFQVDVASTTTPTMNNIELSDALSTSTTMPATDQQDGIGVSNNEDDNSSLVSRTTRFHAPLSSTVAPSSVYNRFPVIDTLSSGRQKINKPNSDSSHSHDSLRGGGHSIYQFHPSTSKLTESISNNDQLRQTIRNRVVTTTPMPRPSSMAEEANELSSSLESAALESSPKPSKRRKRPPQKIVLSNAAEQADDSTATNNLQQESHHQLQAPFERPTGNVQQIQHRPLIIRRKQSASRPNSSATQQHHQHEAAKPVRTNTSNSVDLALLAASSSSPVSKPKRRKKPTQKQPMPARPLDTPIGNLDDTQGLADELPQPSTQLIRKRPGNSHQSSNPIHRFHEHLTIQTAGNATGEPVKIILPIESVLKRKHQDIRTRPLTFVDDDDSTQQQQQQRRQQQSSTTIRHKNVVVSYRPDRDGNLAPSASHSGSSIISTTLPPSRTTLFIHNSSGHRNQNNRHQPDRTASYNDSSTNPAELNENSSLVIPSRVQLGSGNGGDTLLVSIEQQLAQQHQQQQQATGGPVTSFELDNQLEANTTTTTMSPSSSTAFTTTSSTTLAPSTIPHRPIIVINGLTFDQVEGVTNSSNHRDSNNNNNHHHHHQNQGQPQRPKPTNSIESGSMTVVAAASLGHSNSSRPLFGRPSSNTTSSSGHHNQTSDEPPNLSGNPFVSSSSSQQTADSVIGPEMPSFGSSGIGMPSLISLPPGSRPSYNQTLNQRPYNWRVRRRPNGNGNGNHSPSSSTNAPYDHFMGSGSSSSSVGYRPYGLQAFTQMFQWSSIAHAFDNLQVFLARIRTFLLSFMVMFLPPIALASSIVMAMSS